MMSDTTTVNICRSPPSPDEDQEHSSPGRSPKGATDSSGKVRRGKGQADVSSEFVSVLTSKITELEKGISSGNQVEREAAKLRRKQLRELQRYVSDKQNSLEDRIAYVQAKFVQQVTEFLKMEKHYIEVQKDLDLVTKERDKVQVELRKANTLRDRLEELCRGLQRENKEVLEASKRRNEEELKQRQALQLKFTQAINDVTSKMDQQQQERSKQLEENESLRTKLGEVLQQFDAFTQLLNSKDLEVQLANAKTEQQQHIAAQLLAKTELLQSANDSLNKANEIMKNELEHHFAVKEQNVVLHESNKELRAQIESYCDKFAEFQVTLTKSNEMFTTLKKEIETTNKQRSQLVREREELRKRCEKDNSSLMVLLEENRGLKKQLELISQAVQSPGSSSSQQGPLAADFGSNAAEHVRKLRLQKDRLEGLCRVLQTQLKEALQRGSSSEPAGERVGEAEEGGAEAGEGEGELAAHGAAAVTEVATEGGQEAGSLAEHVVEAGQAAEAVAECMAQVQDSIGE